MTKFTDKQSTIFYNEMKESMRTLHNDANKCIIVGVGCSFLFWHFFSTHQTGWTIAVSVCAVASLVISIGYAKGFTHTKQSFTPFLFSMNSEQSHPSKNKSLVC